VVWRTVRFISIDKPADIRNEGFGWRIVRDVQVVGSIWNGNKDILKAAGYSVMRNASGDWLVSYTPRGRGHNR